MITHNDEALTVAEAATVLGVSASRLYQLRTSGELTMVDTKLGKLITAEELARLVKERTGGYRPIGERLRNRLRTEMSG